MSAIVCADGAASLSMQWGVGPCRPDHSEFRKVGEDVILSPRPRDWRSYLESAPVASAAFMAIVDDLPVQEREI